MARARQRFGIALPALTLIAMSGLAGCEQKEPVLRIETPRAKVEVNKSPDGDSIEIRTEREKKVAP